MKPTKKNVKRTASSSQDGFPTLLKHAAMGAGAAIVTAVALCLSGAAICLLSENPASLTGPVGLIALYLAAAIGGWLAARLHKSAFLLCGLLCGGLLTVFFWFLTLFFGNAVQSFSFPLALLLRALTAGAAVLGALLCLKKKAPRRHKRRS